VCYSQTVFHCDLAGIPRSLLSLNANLVAVFSGDQSRTHAYKAVTPGIHGNMVHEFMQDYGSGWLRMYRFISEQHRVRVQAITFLPKSEELCQGTKLVSDRSKHQFEFEFQVPVAQPK
jgi:hypothetical protein